MSAIATEFQGPFWAHLITALAHSLWIGAVVSLILFAVLRRIPAWRADLRYGVCIAGLGLVVFGTLCAWAAVSYEWPEAEEQAVQATLAPETVSELSPNTSAPTVKPASVPLPPRPARNPWTAWLAPLWLLGAGMALGRALTMLSGAGRMRRQCRPVTDESLLAVMDELRLALGITRGVAVLVGDHIVGPVVTGALYPAILLPVSVATGLPMDHVRAILAHELAHVRRHDYLFSVGQTLIESLLFFNPAVWWIGRRIRVEREACCDAYAAAVVGDGAAYAHVLATVADHLHGARLSLNPAMGGDEGSTGLVDRVRRLVRPDHRPHLRVPWYAMAGVTVGVAAFLALLGGCAYMSVSAVAEVMTPAERIEALQVVHETHGPSNDDAREGRTTISGTVRTSDGSPLPEKLGIHSISHSRNGSCLESVGNSVSASGATFEATVRSGSVVLTLKAPGYAIAQSPVLKAVPDAVIDDVELVLEPGYTGTIRLEDPSGAPVAGATVDLMSWIRFEGSGSGTHSISDARSDENGLVSLDHWSPLPHDIKIVASGFQREVVKDAVIGPDEPYLVTLAPAAPTTFVVRSRETGELVPGATWNPLMETVGDSSHSFTQEEYRPVWATGGDDGRVTLDTLRDDGVYHGFVETPDGARMMTLGVRAGTPEKDVLMDPPLYIRGTVTGDLDSLDTWNSEPVVRYEARFSVGNRHDVNRFRAPIEVRDGKGHFEIREIWPGEGTLVAGGITMPLEVRQPVEGLVIDLDSGTASESGSEPLVQTREVVIRLATPKGSPPPTGSIRVNHYSPVDRRSETLDPSIVDGDARLTVPVPRKLNFQATTETIGYWLPHANDVDIPPGDKTLVVLADAVPAGAVYGRLVDSDGAPVPGAFVTVCMAERPEVMEKRGGFLNLDGIRTGSDGRFAAGPLPLGGIYAIVSHTGPQYVVTEPLRVDEDTPLHEVSLQHVEGLALPVQVLDPEGKPARVPIGLHYSSPYNHGFGGSPVQLDRFGRCTFEHVNPDVPGHYSVEIRPLADYRPVSQEVVPGKGLVTIQLEHGQVVEGTLVDDATGAPLKDIEVYALPVDFSVPEVHGYVDADQPTDEEGRFKFTTLGKREYKLNARSVNEVGETVVTGGQSESAVLRVVQMGDHRPFR